jgi:hypothetical protein
MPPCLDTYVWIDGRSQSTIAAFLERYVDIERSADRGGEELMMLPLAFNGAEDDLALDDWEWVPVATLDDILAAGLAQPPRAFRVYLHTRDEDLCGAILCFTTDGGMVLGLSVDDPLNEPARLAVARSRLEQLSASFGARRGWIVGEEPPPVDPARDEPWNRAVATLP